MKFRPRENELKQAVIHYLKLRGFLVWRQNSGRVRGIYRMNTADGMADVCAIAPPSGRFIAVETKRRGCKATPDQLAFLEEVRRVGGIGVVAYSLDDVVEAIELRVGAQT